MNQPATYPAASPLQMLSLRPGSDTTPVDGKASFVRMPIVRIPCESELSRQP